MESEHIPWNTPEFPESLYGIAGISARTSVSKTKLHVMLLCSSLTHIRLLLWIVGFPHFTPARIEELPRHS